MQKKILVILTGGTIGSISKGGVIDVDTSTRYVLLDCYEKKTNESSEQFEVSTPLNLLSENLIPTDWGRLVDEITKKDLSKYAGVIVTHGTDTLPYTSAVLSFVFNSINIPLVIVSSNNPLENSNSNGLDNFIGAVNFIRSSLASGVFVVYRNDAEETKIHFGSRITEAFPFTHQFRSQKDAYLGTISGKDIVLNNTHNFAPQTIDEVKNRKKIPIGSVNFSDEIMLIKPYPGMNYNLLDFSNNKPRAILHDLYHSGTACVRHDLGEKYSIVNFAKRCELLDIDFYIAPISAISDSSYATSQQLLDAGVIPLPDMSIEACIAKLSIAYGTYTDRADAKKFLIDNELFFEFIVPAK